MANQQRRSPRSRGGLTLVEVVMAAGVLSVVLLGMFSAMNASQQSDVLTRERAAASEACHAMLDSMLTGSVPGAGTALEVQFPVNYATGNGNVALEPAAAYPSDPWTFIGQTQPTMTVAGVAVAKVGVNVGTTDEANDDLMEVRVLVAWRAADGTDQRVEAVSRRVR